MKNYEKVTNLLKELKEETTNYKAYELITLEDFEKKLLTWKESIITLLNTDKFQIIYIARINKIELKTTYGNQNVTENYIKELMSLVNLVEKYNK